MPGKVGVKIKAGRNLPVMDRSSDTTDAYVEIKLGCVTHKTDVCRKSLNPQWNTDWFRFEVDDAELQDEPLQIRLMDHDTYSANDAIGKVNISLNPLCLETSGQATHGKGTVLSGWIPVFDTMHGIRGEVYVIVKVDLFSDVNKFRQSSCGIPFFHSQCVPYGYRAQVIHGFVEELVVNDDPEYQWIDKIRTPRASNEARQVVFLKLSGQVQRKMGLKAINMGANAVIGYTQCFDLEGDVGVVARGIGTAVTLIKDASIQPALADNALIEECTLKYLEFLTSGLIEEPEYKLEIRKSHSATTFGLIRAADADEDTEKMLALMRQEDERGEKPKKKLKHHVRRLTNSSRNLFSEKYSAFMRKIGDSVDSKSSDNTSHSLSSLILSTFGKEGSASPKRRNSKSKPKARKPRTARKYQSLKKITHPMVRSISDDSAMKHSLTTAGPIDKVAHPNTSDVSDFEDSTRSSPNICAAERQLKGRRAKAVSGTPFGEFSKHEPHLLNTALKSCSSSALSLTESSSSESAESEANSADLYKENEMFYDIKEHAEEEKEENERLDNAEEIGAKSVPVKADERPRHSIVAEWRKFSQHIQALINKPRKHFDAPRKIKGGALKAQRRSPPKTLNLNCCSTLTRQSFYSSQPDMLMECVPALQPPHTRSLTNLTLNANAAQSLNTAIAKDTAKRIMSPPKPKFPVFRISPSTPTPSESENSQVSPTEPKFMLVTDTKYPKLTISSHSLSLDSPHLLSATTQPHSLTSTPKQSPCQHNTRTRTINMNTNLSNTNNSSLLASPLPTTLNRHRRSLNEMNAGTDSPSMKHLTSAASAAVVAAAGITHATGPLMGSRSKLSLSPAKGATGGTQSTSQSESNSSGTASTAATVLPAKEIGEMCRRSSDSDLSVTPKGNSICVPSERLVAATAMMRLSQPVTGKNTNTDSLDMLEYPFLTMTKYPPGFILHLGATVAARSVKLLERVPNPDEPEVRDSWWTELRMEIRSHARALGCNVVLGYAEATTISDDVCVLSATGTAAVINMSYNRSISQNDIFTTSKPGVGINAMSTSLEERDMGKELRNGVANEMLAKDPTTSTSTAQATNVNAGSKKSFLPPLNIAKNTCTICHVPYNLTSVPLNVKMKKCDICHKGRVPDVLLATLEMPDYLQVTGRGCFMQAQVVRPKKDLRSELNAKEISDGLPFLEYELHRVLINKLKAKGMNAIFGLKTQVAIGERMIALIATGTALFLSALPVPQVPKIVAGNSWTDKQKLNELQKKLQETFERNQEIYQLKCIDPDYVPTTGSGSNQDKQSDTDESDDEAIDIDLNCGNKDTCVLEVDDIEDLEIISLLMEPYPPEGFHVVNTQMVPGLADMEAVKNLQMFTQVWRAKLEIGQTISGFPKHFQRLLQTIYFKLRTMIPCAICDLRFRLDLPESDQIQLLVTGMALGLGETNKAKYAKRKPATTNGLSEAQLNMNEAHDSNGSIHGGNKRALQEDDYIFPLDEDHMVQTPTPTSNLPPMGAHSIKMRKTSPSLSGSKGSTTTLLRNRYFPLRDRYGVDITPLSFIPCGRIEKYLGNLNFFFIRESTSVRENGGISGFVHSFITELLAVVRAHISTLGGNAMVSFYMTELILVDNQHKNQGQCLISIGGDVVYVSYYTDD